MIFSTKTHWYKTTFPGSNNVCSLYIQGYAGSAFCEVVDAATSSRTTLVNISIALKLFLSAYPFTTAKSTQNSGKALREQNCQLNFKKSSRLVVYLFI